jgi:hypothetical protein
MNCEEKRKIPAIVLFVALVMCACVGEDLAGEGDVSLEVSGGAALREGFPHTEGDATHAFVKYAARAQARTSTE